MASGCTLPGIYTDFHLRSVSGPSNIQQYGLFIGLGTSSQNSSLWPSLILNETSFRSTGFCAAGSTPQCIGASNSEFNTTSSSTWRDSPSYASLDNSSLYTNVSYHYGKDTLNIYSHFFDPSPPFGTFIQDFPVTIVNNYTSRTNPFFAPGGDLGLGSASTILNTLYKQNLISSRSYGLYVGNGISGKEGTANGSLVLGGYDSTRFFEPVHTYTQVPISPSNGFSPFKIKITSVTVDIAPGRSVELTDQGGFDAFLTTSQYPIQLPKSVTQRLADNVSAGQVRNDDDTLRIPIDFKGNLTVRLDDGLQVTFDSNWLSNSPNTSSISASPLDNGANVAFFNTTFTNISKSSPEPPLLFGAAFLEQLYLFVLHDGPSPSFALARANPEAKFVTQQPLCPGVSIEVAKPVNISPFIQQGMIGAVLGGVIGGIALIAFVVFIVKFKLPQWLEARRAKAQDSKVTEKTTSKEFKENRPKFTIKPLKQARFGQSETQIESFPNSSRPTNAMDRTGSSSSNASSSTQVSVSGTKVTISEPKNIEMTPYKKSQKPIPLDFGFNSNRVSLNPRDSRNPYSTRRFSIKPKRSSSIYSTD